MKTCRLIDLDHLDYPSALKLMRGLVQARLADGPDVLILLEHEPVFTLGRRTPPGDILAGETLLARHGIEAHRIERGGLATYHGPGQIVVYPVVRLRPLGLGVAEFVNRLEEMAIRAAADFGLEANRLAGHPGVFVGLRKIASIGLAVRRGVTFHGLALNYNPNLDHFHLINPCGLDPDRISSMTRLLDRPVDPKALRQGLQRHFLTLTGLDLVPWTLDEAWEAVKHAENPA
jgi:lipoate-protein ligase B